MSRKLFFTIGSLLLLLALGVWGASGQGGQEFEEVPIITTATNVVGTGTYVAAEAYAVPAGEDPEEQPVQAFILPYGITPNMHIETIEDFVQPEPAVEGFTFEWSLEAPEGSEAELIDGPVAIFMADVEGQYVLTLTATDENGNSGTTSWTVWAATYIGVGGLDGTEPQEPQCASCHEDQADAWSATGHASMFTRAVDGEVSSHYGPNCVSCHTTGFNNRPEAVNGGFDDIVAESGWLFPEELVPGTWDTIVAENPEVAALANIQCESCHGPGSLHPPAEIEDEEGGSQPAVPGPIGLGLDYGTCAQCHAEEPYHVFPQEWELSGHAAKNARAFWYPIGEDHQACVRCHSGLGYIDYTNGLPQEEWRIDYQVITCAVCHDPHDADNPHQLRVFDEVLLPDGTDVASAGPAATCMSCHNARTDPVAAVEGENFRTPHHSTAAELINETGGYTWGETLPTSTHGRIVENTCIGCHMADSPGMDNMGTPDDRSDDQPLPGHLTVGEHTFSMVSPVDGTENVAACQQCHDGAESFEFEARRDYDGDGTIETNQEEVNGLLELLQAALEENGVEVLTHYPYFNMPENPSVDVLGAAYNLQFVNSAGSVDHNLRYIVSLLQLSYERLTGEAVPNAYILEPK